ncbi:TetR/AcrR family transcriptional regulator [Amycolatopsis sp. Poz14]|uniref:TetR/AcrR family transcriptional regulator n=1 Tax=Amycolatopsis sp. Poz14 TaxID=1447705 RepID=UPI001EE8A015|nr:TetR/AcrR family transcriptional regulator [Amycolatopsis sp. Poz14]MCG3750030.1 TetR/AcrR family transcriptional regulator [Amycolatopsis sp. Poz14]
MSSAKKPRADAERNRLRLLAAARKAFGEGDEPVTLERVAREAGVGIGTLYRHFPTREALVEALYRDELAQVVASAPKLLESEKPLRALRRWMDRFAEYASTKHDMADTLRAIIEAGTVDMTQVRAELTEAVQLIMDAGAADGTLRTDVRAQDVVVTVVGACSMRTLPDGPEQLDRMLDLILAGVRQPPS